MFQINYSVPFQFRLMLAGNARSLPKSEATERHFLVAWTNTLSFYATELFTTAKMARQRPKRPVC